MQPTPTTANTLGLPNYQQGRTLYTLKRLGMPDRSLLSTRGSTRQSRPSGVATAPLVFSLLWRASSRDMAIVRLVERRTDKPRLAPSRFLIECNTRSPGTGRSWCASSRGLLCSTQCNSRPLALVRRAGFGSPAVNMRSAWSRDHGNY